VFSLRYGLNFKALFRRAWPSKGYEIRVDRNRSSPVSARATGLQQQTESRLFFQLTLFRQSTSPTGPDSPLRLVSRMRTHAIHRRIIILFDSAILTPEVTVVSVERQ
jgi:hypothetical protein